MLLKPSDWLERYVDPAGVYTEDKLRELRDGCGIVYEYGVLTSRRKHDKPYLNYGRHSSLELHTPAQLRKVAHDIDEVIDDDLMDAVEDHDGLTCFGWEIIVAVWKCVGPIISIQPPSTLLHEPWRKAKLDIDSLRRMGL